MAKDIIHLYGASGAGTSTLGKYISERLGYRFMDTDDYFWLPVEPPYTIKRAVSERLQMMNTDLAGTDKAVISGSLTGWGDVLIPQFTLAIRMVTDTDIRIARLKERERATFGSRIDPGGDMYEHHQSFLKWAADYDSGGTDMRSRAKHDQWQTLLQCKQLTLSGEEPLGDNLMRIEEALGVR